MTERAGRQALVGAAAAIVLIVAGALAASGVDAVEVVATFFVVPVFAVGLSRGRLWALVAAAGAVVLYGVLRQPDIAEVGLVGVGVLVVARAFTFVVVGHVGVLAQRLLEILTDDTADRTRRPPTRQAARQRGHQREPVPPRAEPARAWSTAETPAVADHSPAPVFAAPAKVAEGSYGDAYDVEGDAYGEGYGEEGNEYTQAYGSADAVYDDDGYQDHQPEGSYDDGPYTPHSHPPIVADPPGGDDDQPWAPREPVPAVVDPETRLWTPRFLCDRLAAEQTRAARSHTPFSLVMLQVPDAPLAALPYRRQITLLRDLGQQFVGGGLLDHLVHVPDQTQHWFAVVLPGADRAMAQDLEQRLRVGLSGYLRSRGVRLGEIESASLTAPDDDPAMGAIWQSLIERGDPDAARSMVYDD